MITDKVVITFNSQEIVRLTKILLDEEKEEASTCLKEVLKPRVDQVIQNH